MLDGDFGPDPGTGLKWPPFRTFGENYYTYQLLLDLKVPDDMAVRTEPHPRYYTSPDDDVPLAVPALLRTSWWPMISFVVFKAPPEGCTHVFRPGEPFMQMVFVPAEPQFELVEMDLDEAAEREMRGRRIHASRDTLGKGDDVDVVDRHRVRRHLSPHPARRQGQGERERRRIKPRHGSRQSEKQNLARSGSLARFRSEARPLQSTQRLSAPPRPHPACQ